MPAVTEQRFSRSSPEGSGIETAFILGAGLGTRLRPLTERCPKPLVPVRNRPLITYAFDHVIEAGVKRIIVNTHHCPEVYDELFPTGVYRGVPLTFRNEPNVLETGGGIRNVADLLGGQPFVVYNGDILTDLPLAPAFTAHLEQGNEVTLLLRSQGAREVDMDPVSGRILDFGNRLHPDRPGPYLFTGIYVVSPEFIDRIPPATKISVVPAFLEMIRSGARFGGVLVDGGDWWELGYREKYLEVHRLLHEREGVPAIEPNAKLFPGATVTGFSAIGANACVEPGATLHNSVIWPNARVAAGSHLDHCVVTSGVTAEGQHSNTDF